MVNLISILIIVLFIYVLLSLTLRTVIDMKYDEKLRVSTMGLRGWKGENKKIYHRTESTPYLALKNLAKKYKVNEKDSLVDFGSGRGRVAIFLYDNLNIPITGIELNELTYNEANANKESYLNRHRKLKITERGHVDFIKMSRDTEFEDVEGLLKEPEANIKSEYSSERNMKTHKERLSFVKDYAEKYKIKINDNKFFFFNPFNVKIFEKVVANIIKSADEHNKEVEIILYYPTRSYRKFLKTTPFRLNKTIKMKAAISSLEKFHIYKYSPNS